MMPLHRRHGGASRPLDNEATGSSISPDGGDQYEHGKEGLTRTPSLNKQQHSLIVVGLVTLQMVLMGVAAVNARVKSFSHLIPILLAAFITSLPAFLILGVGLGVVGSSNRDLPHQRYIPLAIAATILGNQLPVFLSAGMAAAGIYIFGLASRPIPVESHHQIKKKDGSSTGGGTDDNIKTTTTTISGPVKTVFAALLMVAVLLMENFFVWVVAATYKPSHSIATGDLPKPLQDNGQLTMAYLFSEVLELTKRDVVKVRGMINVEWLLVSGLGLSLVAMEMHGSTMRRNLWSVSMRGVLTLAAARSIRVFSFLITVLPSQNPRCYFGHFPYPPPQEWLPWLMVGVIPQVNGGCNDLIISGHATVTATMTCVVTSVVGKPLFTAALWMFVAMDYMVEVYEGFHYSVDMFLGAVLVNLIWTIMASIEESGHQDQISPQKEFYPLLDISHSDLIRYLIPALGAYLQVVGIIPQNVGIYTIVVYMVAVVYQMYRFGFQQYTQHTLFCLLYMGLGVFL